MPTDNEHRPKKERVNSALPNIYMGRSVLCMIVCKHAIMVTLFFVGSCCPTWLKISVI